MSRENLSPAVRLALRIEHIMMTRLVPKDNAGILFKWFFKIPVLFYKIGLPLFGNFILLLTTAGRKTGKPRHTPLEYRRDESGNFIVMAGWGGKTDWVRNIEKNPRVRAQAGRTRFEAQAERLTDEEVAAWMHHAAQENPPSIDVWSRWAGEKLDGSPESMKRAAKFFPSFRLRPIH